MKTEPSYLIELPVFEGPLDLLLELIERAELDITKVSLARVTDQYLEYLRQLSHYELEDLSSFLVIAARLLQIKSEALLPRPPEREPGEEDPGDALARQLVAYKKYKQIAILLAEREEEGLRTFLRQAPAPLPEPSPDLAEISLGDLLLALEQIAEHERGSGVGIEQVVARPVVRIRDRIQRIVDSIRSFGRTTFRNVVEDVGSRLEIVVSFLAMLELVKQGQVQADQDQLFGDIEIHPAADWDDAQELDFELEFDE
jgi:segregation and condensation protein A